MEAGRLTDHCETQGLFASIVHALRSRLCDSLQSAKVTHMPEPPPVDLSAALEALREQLEDAWAAGQGRRVRFRVSDVTLTVQVAARAENKVGGKLRWWVLEGGGEHSSAHEATQTLVLTLTPGLYDDAGPPAPLDVSGQQAEPGR
jgi:hypothetical protein